MDKYLDILHEYWGYPDFRGIQRDIIESIGSGKDTLGLMPTGGGKSLTFQVPALAQKGVCIVISPLISLMKDQVDHLRQKNIGAAAIYSGMRRDDIVATLENCVFGGIKILYVSPERIGSDLFRAKLLHMKVSFITVDEAHCISQWGYDFRPSYLQISEIRKLVPDAPILALTATATPEVIKDIQVQLGFKHENVFRMSFERKNLVYVVRKTEDKDSEAVHILQSVSGSAIIYVRSRKRTKQMAELLHNNDISSTWYHAGLEPAEKAQRQEDWQNGKIRVIVATNAFGMGIDKPDVRLVIHPDAPSSIEAYFQEAGRAGRDGKKSFAVLLWNKGDERKLNKRIDDTFPPKDEIRDVYEHLAYSFQVGVNSGGGSTFEFNIDDFSRTFHFFPVRVNSALVILQRAGYIFYEPDPENLSRVRFLLTRNELYRLENQPKNEEAVITALLRNYGGLFVDYVYIDESYVAKDCGLTRDDVYLALKALSQKRIISFVPKKNTPLVRYAIDRVDGQDVVLSENVYDKRKEQFAKRIASVLEYMGNDRVCRSRQLLAYFGETKVKDCGQCDVCVSYKDNKDTRSEFKDAKRRIMEILEDGEKHFIRELYKVKARDSVIDEALEYLVQEEKIYIDGSFIKKA